jgi:hypothetical protein
MTTFNRNMEFWNNNDGTLHVGCEACVWPGVDVHEATAREAIGEAFSKHSCRDWANVCEIQGKLSAQ